MKWFSSDWHLFHKNIIKYSDRPFKNVDEMNSKILSMFDLLTKDGDDVYFLGDFAFLKPKNEKKVEEYLKKITDKVNLYITYGNHDNYYMKKLYSKYAVKTGWLNKIKIDDKTVTLCHFPMTAYHKSHWNAWHLYGHLHRNTNNEIQGKRMNVCLEANNYTMVNEDDIVKFMSSRPDNWDYLTKTG